MAVAGKLAGGLGCWVTGRLAGWLAGWLAGLAGWLAGWLTDWLTGRLPVFCFTRVRRLFGFVSVSK